MPKYQSTQKTPWTQSANTLIDTLNAVFDAQQKRKQTEEESLFRKSEQERKLAAERVKFAMDHGSGADYDAAVAYYNSLSPNIKLPSRKPEAMQEYESSLQPQVKSPGMAEVPVPDLSKMGFTGLPETGTAPIEKAGPPQVTPGAQPDIGRKLQALIQSTGMGADRAIQQLKLEQEQEKLKQPSPSTEPYKLGQLVNDIQLGGKVYQGTYAGLNPDNTPRFVNLQEKKEVFKDQVIGQIPGYFVTFDASSKKSSLVPMPSGVGTVGPRTAPPLNSLQQNDLKFGETLLKIIGDVNSLYYAPRSKDDSTPKGKDWVGAFDALRGTFGRYVNKASTPDEQKFRVKLESIYNMKGKEQAGSAWSKPEMDRIKAELGTAYRGDQSFEEALKNVEEVIKQKIASIYEVAQQTGTYLPGLNNEVPVIGNQRPAQKTQKKIGRFTVEVVP